MLKVIGCLVVAVLISNDAHARPLTAAELTEASRVLGGLVDFSKVDVVNGTGFDPRAWGPNTTGHFVTLENTIHVPGSYYRADLSQDLTMMATLVHELGHVFQYQTDPNYHWTKAAAEGLKANTYNIDLDSSPTYRALGYEQQAEVIRLYYVAIVQNDWGTLDKLNRILKAPPGSCSTDFL